MALADAMTKGEGQPPPNLRPGTARERCQLCRFFDGKGECRKYSYPVRPNQLSDSFSPATAPDAGLRDQMQQAMAQTPGGQGNGG